MKRYRALLADKLMPWVAANATVWPSTHANQAVLLKQIAELEAEAATNRGAVEALKFYADKANYTAQNPPGSGSPIWRDAGTRARGALGGAVVSWLIYDDRENPDVPITFSVVDVEARDFEARGFRVVECVPVGQGVVSREDADAVVRAWDAWVADPEPLASPDALKAAIDKLREQ